MTINSNAVDIFKKALSEGEIFADSQKVSSPKFTDCLVRCCPGYSSAFQQAGLCPREKENSTARIAQMRVLNRDKALACYENLPPFVGKIADCPRSENSTRKGVVPAKILIYLIVGHIFLG